MLPELQKSMDNQIHSIYNYYNMLNDIIIKTDNFFNCKHSFSHPIAAVSWTWTNYDIWVLENLSAQELNCIFTVAIFDNSDSKGSVCCSLDVIEYHKTPFDSIYNKGTCKNNTISNYMKSLKVLIKNFKEPEH